MSGARDKITSNTMETDKPKRKRSKKVESNVEGDKTFNVKPKQNRNKIIKMSKVESKIAEPTGRRIKTEIFDCKLENHFVVTIHQPFLYTKGLVFELLQDKVKSLCVTESDGIVTTYLQYNTPRSLTCLTKEINEHFKDAGHLIIVSATDSREELIRQMTELDLQPLFKDIEAREFHFNLQAMLWASMIPSFSCLDPFVIRYKECYPYLFALFEHVKGL